MPRAFSIALVLLTTLSSANVEASPPPRADTSEADDPVVARVNFRVVRQSELAAAVAKREDGSVRAALRELSERAMLLQEADRSGMGQGLPQQPDERAKAFLNRIISPRVICENITQRELRQMYSVMRPRFIRGHLYRIAELRWTCPDNLEPESGACREQGIVWANTQWRPVVGDVRTGVDLYWLGQLTMGRGPIQYNEHTIHVDEHGRASVAPNIAAVITGLSVGQAVVTDSLSGIRIQVLLEHRPPIHRELTDPGVEAEVRAELCPRLVTANQRNYVETLLEHAVIEIRRGVLPPAPESPQTGGSGP